MNLKETIKVSIRSIKTNGMRSFLTMLGIIIGVAAVILLVSLGQGASNSITSEIQGLGSNLLIVTPSQGQPGKNTGAVSANTLTIADAEAIGLQPSVKYAAPYIRKNIQVSWRNNDYTTALEGTTEQYSQVRNLKLEKGRFFSKYEVLGESNVVVLGSEVVKNLFADPKADVVGRQVEINQLPFTIIGILETQGSQGMQNNDDVVIMPITTVMNRMFGDKNISMIYLSAQSANLMSQAQQEVKSALRIQHKLTPQEENDFTITNQAQILEIAEGITGILTALLTGIAGVSLAVGGIGIMNIMLVSVTERTKEIGIRKAIGAKRSVILTQFLAESVMLSLLGGIIGILVGVASAVLINAVTPLPAAVSLSPIIYSFVFAMMVGIIFGVYPARKAASLNPIDALRYE